MCEACGARDAFPGHPRHIAGLIRSKYERDYGWGDQWAGFDPATRADFYARTFTAEFVTGIDNLIDFNAKSAREEGLCFFESCNGRPGPLSRLTAQPEKI